jgi:hypothetical protein
MSASSSPEPVDVDQVLAAAFPGGWPAEAVAFVKLLLERGLMTSSIGGGNVLISGLPKPQRVSTHPDGVFSFLKHVMQTTAIFLIIAIPAVALEFALKQLVKQDISGEILIKGLETGKYAILAFDIAFLILRLAHHIWKYGRGLQW